MSKIEKLIKKFKEKPESLKFFEIEKILDFLEFKNISTKGSHFKFKNEKTVKDIILPIHNKDIKPFYKKMILKIVKDLLK